MEDRIRISGVVKESIVDGPGIRYVIFTQGCPHHCEGCHNPETHDFNGGKVVSIQKLLDDIKKNPLVHGVTLSGGDPLAQPKEVAEFIDRLDKNKYHLMVYTGYTYEDLLEKAKQNVNIQYILENIDILIDGKFEKDLKSDSVLFRGSTNQRAINTKESLKTGSIVLHTF